MKEDNSAWLLIGGIGCFFLFSQPLDNYFTVYVRYCPKENQRTETMLGEQKYIESCTPDWTYFKNTYRIDYEHNQLIPKELPGIFSQTNCTIYDKNNFYCDNTPREDDDYTMSKGTLGLHSLDTTDTQQTSAIPYYLSVIRNLFK